MSDEEFIESIHNGEIPLSSGDVIKKIQSQAIRITKITDNDLFRVELALLLNTNKNFRYKYSAIQDEIFRLVKEVQKYMDDDDNWSDDII